MTGKEKGSSVFVEEEQPTEEKPKEELKKPEKEEFRVKTRTKEDKAKYLNILDHGDSGSGKTTFAATMIEVGLKTLIIVFNEDELMTLDSRGITGYDYLLVTDYAKLWPLYLSLRKNEAKYEGVVLDGLADFQQHAKDYELAGVSGVTFEFMKEAMKGNKRMYLQNWGNLLEMTRHFLDPFLKLPFHKIVTCVSESDEDPKTGKLKIYPALQGSMQQLISAHFSVVAYSYIAHRGDKTYWCLTTQPHESIATKDRTNLNRVLYKPHFRTFLEAHLEGKRDEPDELQQKLAKALIVRPQATTTGKD